MQVWARGVRVQMCTERARKLYGVVNTPGYLFRIYLQHLHS